MKLIRFGEAGNEKPGVELPDGTRYDLSSKFEDYDSAFLADSSLERLAGLEIEKFPTINPDVRLGTPISNPGKIICVGLNYANHAKEAGMEPPKEPILFFKATTSLCGPFDHLVIPKGSVKSDWEVELNVVIEKKAQHVAKSEAMDYVAGFTLTNDYSEREWQLERGGQWVKGKSCDTFSPVGPYLVTKDEIPDPNNLGMWLKVNGEVKQQSSTKNYIFQIDEVVSYISQFMTLMPGDMIFTGTPPGVGMGFNPPQFLQPGDVVELGIEGLGSSRQEAIAWS